MKVSRLFSLLVVLLVLLSFTTPNAQAQDPASNTLTVNVLSATVITNATQVTSAPNIDAQARDVSKTQGWNKADIFVSATISPTAIVTATIQFSPDTTNWANGYSEYWTGSAIGQNPQRIVLSAAGTGYVSVPLAGSNWRVSLTSTGTVTATVKATLRR